MNYPDAKYELFQINTNDIWNYEERCYHYPSRLSDHLIDRLIELLKREIPKNGSPFVTPQEEGDPHYTYWKSVIKRNLLKSEKTDPFEVDEFRTNKGFYSDDSSIEILRDNEEFDFCFALKMRQYEGKLLKLYDFINFHLNQNFSGDQVQFNKFLKLITMQFNDSFLSSKIVSVVEDYIMNCREISKPKSMNKALRTVRDKSTNLDSFLIKSDINGFENDSITWAEITSKLKSEGFIDSTSSASSLRKVFNNVKLKSDKRVI